MSPEEPAGLVLAPELNNSVEDFMGGTRLSVPIGDSPIVCPMSIPNFLSTTELKIPLSTIVQGWVSDVPKFKHGIISKHFELEG